MTGASWVKVEKIRRNDQYGNRNQLTQYIQHIFASYYVLGGVLRDKGSKVNNIQDSPGTYILIKDLKKDRG